MRTGKATDLALVLAEGEGQRIEFKERLSGLDREFCAFANASGGSIFLGVNDHAQVVGIADSNELRSRIHDIARNCDPAVTVDLAWHPEGVLEVRVVEGVSKPHQCREGFFLRNGPNCQKLRRDEIARIVMASGSHRFDETLNREFRFPRDFDSAKLRGYLQAAGIGHRAGARSLLTSLDVAVEEGAALHLRQAGVLFFAHDPQRFLRESYISAVRYEGIERFAVIDRAEMVGDPLSMIEETLGFIRRNIRVRQTVTGDARRTEIHEYPMVAVREAVINAVMHRDYYYDASHIYVHIFADRLEVESPGGLPLGLGLDDLGRRSVRRNRAIADLLYRAKFVERIGSGIQRMERSLAENGNPPMEISASNFFVVRFYPRIEPAGTMDLTRRQGQLCRHLSERGALTKSELASLLGVSGDTVLRDMAPLLRARVLERDGTGRGTRYLLADGEPMP